MIAVKSNNLKNNTLIGSYVIIPKSQVGSPFELTEKEWNDSRSLMITVKEYIDNKYNIIYSIYKTIQHTLKITWNYITAQLFKI
jgi:hypothetical protein